MTSTTLSSIATSIVAPSASTPTAIAALYGSNARSEAIYAALLNAAKHASLAPLSPSPPGEQLAKVGAANILLDDVAPPALQIGFFTSRLEALPSPVAILVGVVLILLGLALCAGGARSLVWLNAWGKPRGTFEGRPYIAGGIGGLAFGGVAGALFTSFVILLVSAHQQSPSLGSWPTIAIVTCSYILGSALGGRWRFAARTCVGLVGGLSLVLLLISTVQLRTLLPRLILLAIIVPIAVLVSNLSATRKSLSVFAALAGSYLFILGIDNFTHFGFLDLLSLLVATNGVGDSVKPDSIVVQWSTGSAKGLLAGWWLSCIVSAVWQWWSTVEGAGDVEEAWNNYLGQVVSSNPDPRGTYIRTPTFLQRLFNPRGTRAAVFAGTEFPRRRPWDDAEKGKDWDSDVDTISALPVQYGAVRKAVEEADEDEEAEREEKEWRAEMALAKYRKSSDQASILSGDTAVASVTSTSKGAAKTSKAKGDVQTPAGPGEAREETDYFAKRSPAPASYFPLTLPTTPTLSGEPTSPSSPGAPPAPNVVPATPSLIHAVQRINAAQRQARGDIGNALPASAFSSSSSPQSGGEVPQEVPSPKTELIPRRSMSKRRGQSWDEFWKDVVKKTEEKK